MNVVNSLSTTDRNVLAVVSGVDTSTHVLEAAIERAEQELASLVVVYVMPRRQYEAAQRSVASSHDLAGDGFTFSHTQAMEEAKNVAERAVERAIGGRDIQFTTVGEIGKFVPTVLDVAMTRKKPSHDLRHLIFDNIGAVGYLDARGRLTSYTEDGVRHYRPADSGDETGAETETEAVGVAADETSV